MKIVVARYNEDIEWTKQFPNVVIYNKGEPLLTETNVISLQNVGREGHTYYTHIYNNYDNLDDYTVFLQGNPFDHSPRLVEKINKYTKYLNGEMPYKNWNLDFWFLSESCNTSNLSGCPHHPGLPMSEVYETLFNEKKTEKSFLYGGGAQFIVSKERILKNSKEFYGKIIKMLEYDVNPIEGFVIERFHSLFFT